MSLNQPQAFEPLLPHPYFGFSLPQTAAPELTGALNGLDSALCDAAYNYSFAYYFDESGRLMRRIAPTGDGDVSVLDQTPEWTYSRMRKVFEQLLLSPPPPAFEPCPTYQPDEQVSTTTTETRASLVSRFLRLLSRGPKPPAKLIIPGRAERLNREQHARDQFQCLANWFEEQWNSGAAQNALCEWHRQRIQQKPD